jgi:hypothetical protein
MKNFWNKVKGFFYKILNYKAAKVIISVLLSAGLTYLFKSALVFFCFLVLWYLLYILIDKWVKKNDNEELNKLHI